MKLFLIAVALVAVVVADVSELGYNYPEGRPAFDDGAGSYGSASQTSSSYGSVGHSSGGFGGSGAGGHSSGGFGGHSS
ncbi:pupal cuticle protein 20-like, partial [Lucilia cuprina]